MYTFDLTVNARTCTGLYHFDLFLRECILISNNCVICGIWITEYS